MTRGMRVTLAMLAAQTAQASWPAASGTPSPDDKTSARGNDNNSKYHIILVGVLKSEGACICSLSLVESFFRWSSQCQRCPSDGEHSRLGARSKAQSETRWRHHQKSVSDFDNWQFTLVSTSKRIRNKKQITNLYYKLSFTWMLQFTQLCYISNNYGDRYHLLS